MGPGTRIPKTIPDSTIFLKVSTVAKLLSVTKKRVYALIAQRKLKAVKLGPRQTRILRQSLEEYIDFLVRKSTHHQDEND